jgi:hypothetical protein
MKRDDLFERIDPPPGGLAKLRAKMSAPRRRAPRAAALAFAVAVAIVLLFVSRRREPDALASARPHLGLAPLPSTRVALADEEKSSTVLVQVPTKNPNVSFYWASSTDWTR